MPRFEFRFDIAAILLASVLAALGVSAAGANTDSSVSSEEVRSRNDCGAVMLLAGGKGGVSGGDVRSRSRSSGDRQ